MYENKTTPPTRSNVTVLQQLLNHIPRRLINRCAQETGVEAQTRKFSVEGVLRRFKVRIHAVDSSVLQLFANSMDLAKHRRRKAAAKMHLRLDLHSFLPTFLIVGTARQHDNTRARKLCAALLPGEIVLFDKAYVDFLHLADLTARGVAWVTREEPYMATPIDVANANIEISIAMKSIISGKQDVF